MTTYRKILRANIRAELGRNDLSQSEVARRLGMTPPGMTNRMNGRIDFRIGELLSIAELIHVPFSALTEGLDERAADSSEQVER